MRGAQNELAVNSRSMLQIMTAFASYLDLPEAHLKDHSAVPTLEDSPSQDRRGQVRIHSGKNKPAAAFAAVHYRDHWFWIDDGDWRTKRALTAVVIFFTLAETAGNEKLPLITIPAQYSREAKANNLIETRLTVLALGARSRTALICTTL